MSLAQPVFITGAVIFAVSCLLTVAIYLYYVYKGYVIARKLNGATDQTLRSIHWLKSIWIYLTLATIFFIMAALYAVNANGTGFYQRPDLKLTHWARWLFLALAGVLYNGTLAFILSRNEAMLDHQIDNKFQLPYGAQNLFILLYYFMSIVIIAFAALFCVNNTSRIITMVVSLIAFIASLALYFLPYNKFTVKTREDGVFFIGDSAAAETPERQRVITAYRWIFLVTIILSYVINFIIWFLATGNEFTTALNFQNESIAYLVSDVLLFIPGSLMLIGLTFYYNQKTLVSQDETGKLTFQKRHV